MWVLCILYAAPHTHAQETNIEQHSACGENGHRHMETDDLAAPKQPTEPNPKADMWQIKNLHIPKRKNILQDTTNNKRKNPKQIEQK
jgi:hypothetical protein